MNSSYNSQSEQGFSYIDVIIGVMILMVGVLALTSALTVAVVRSRESEQQFVARHHAFSALESVFTARDIPTFGWDGIRNVPVGATPRGFARNADLSLPIRTNAGPDRVIGTNDDAGDVIRGFERRIVITDLCDPERPSANCLPCAAINPAPNCATPGTNSVMMRRVDVTVWYQVNSARRTETASTIIANY